MAPYNRCWVKPSFLNLLRDSCDAYLESSDRGTDKTRSKLITKVSGEIAAIVERTNEPVPDDLEKCVRTWFGNYAAAHAKEDRPEKSKSDRRGHPASSRTWTAKSVCGHMFSEQISDEQKRLSDDGEKDIRNYHPALTNVFDALTAEQRKQCEDLAVEWNTKPLPDHVQLRLSRTIPTDVSDFLKFMKKRTGAVFIAFATYVNEDGEQTYARYETKGLKFFESRQEHRKGVDTVFNMWRDFNIEAAEQADSKEELELDDDGYPLLPTNVIGLRLHRRKAILRQFMGATRKFYKLNGRIPWTDIAEYPSKHLSKMSRLYSDYHLEEPSHMKSDAVDAWLRHWLNLQMKGKRPLVLMGSSENLSRAHAAKSSTPPISTKRGKGKGKARYVEPDSSDGAEHVDKGDGDLRPGSPASNSGANTHRASPAASLTGPDNRLGLPTTPCSGSINKESRCEFLMSLSEDVNYQKLVLLLRAAEDGELLERSPPEWACWDSMDNYLSDAFYDTTSSFSLSTFMQWISTDPITADGGLLASYEQVELAILAIGLALRGLWVAQFPEQYPHVPAHVLNSPYPFSEYHRIGQNVKDLISGYAEVLHDIEAGNPHMQPPRKQSTIGGTSKAKRPSDTVGNKRHQGLSGVPTALLPLREEVGLAGADWATLGPEWQALAALWLRAEACASKSGRTDLTMDEVSSSSIPDEWKEWIIAKINKTPASPPLDTFGQVLTTFLSRLPQSVFKVGGTVITQVWCRPGKTGIVGLMLCLRWQAKYSDTGHNWKANIKRVERIFNAIIAHPDLQREKRTGIPSERATSRARKRSRI